MRRAAAYVGPCDLETAALAVESVCGKLGMSSRRQALGSGRLRIETVQEQHWLKILLGVLPQKVKWELEEVGGQLSVSSEFGVFRWYLALTTGLGH